MLIFYALIVAVPSYIAMTKLGGANPLVAASFSAALSLFALPAATLTVPFAPLYFTFATMTATDKFGTRKALAWAGIVAIAVFAIAITIPFHFQGYKELASKCSSGAYCGPGRGLGITQFQIPGMYSYILTFYEVGYVYLLATSFAVIAGQFTKNQIVDYSTKFASLGFVAFTLFEFNQYQIINVVME
jgi:hypothetical protein